MNIVAKMTSLAGKKRKRKVREHIHDGLSNEITFTHRENKFVLYLLTPSQVVKDQVQMKQKGENEKKKKIK